MRGLQGLYCKYCICWELIGVLVVFTDLSSIISLFLFLSLLFFYFIFWSQEKLFIAEHMKFSE